MYAVLHRVGCPGTLLPRINFVKNLVYNLNQAQDKKTALKKEVRGWEIGCFCPLVLFALHSVSVLVREERRRERPREKEKVRLREYDRSK